MSGAFDPSVFDPAVFDVDDSDRVVPLAVVGVDVPDMVAVALSRLLEQDKNKPNIAALVTTLVSPVQDVVNANWQLATQRTIYNSVGQQLDDIGALVGLPRLGLDDDDYRVQLFVEIKVNRSEGNVEDLIAIAVLALNNPSAVVRVVTTHIIGGVQLAPDAFVEVLVLNVAITNALGMALFSFISRAVDAGVRSFVKWSTVQPSQTFKFDTGPGFDSGFLSDAMEG